MRDIFNQWNRQLGWALAPSRGLGSGLQALMFVRLGVAYAVLLILVLKQVVGDFPLASSTLVLSYGLLALIFLVNLVQAEALERTTPSWGWVVGNLVFDSALSTTLLVASAGTTGYLGLFFLIQILFVALIFYQREALLSALLASVGMAVVSSLTVQGWSVWALYSGLFLTLGIVGGYLSEALHHTTQSLKEESEKVESLQAFHERIIQELPTGLMTVDASLNIKLINPAGLHILGKEREELAGRSLGEVEPGLAAFFTQIDSEDVDEDVEEQELDATTALSTTSGKRRRSFFVHPRSESSTRLQQCVEIGVGSKTRIIRGDVAQVASRVRVLLFQDVTKLLHLEERLRQNDKLAAVGQLAAGIAHEIRNPLAGVSGSIEMLRANPTELATDESGRLMDIAIREIDRLNELISEFLDFVKPAPMRFQPVDLTELIQEVVRAATQSPLIKGRVSLSAAKAEEVTALGNRGKLSQVLWNLITNAAQAIEEQGAIEVGCNKVNDQTVKVWVKDSGKGMTEEVRGRLFEPFFTTKDKGTGLGLATVYKIVDSHHGEVEVKTAPGKGTTFFLYFQNAEQEPS